MLQVLPTSQREYPIKRGEEKDSFQGFRADIVLIILVALSPGLFFTVFMMLGLPSGLDIIPMSEDNNWLLILRSHGLAAQAQAFWAMNDRNPLSPWWYIAAQKLYTGFADGPLLTRLTINPILASACYAAVRTTTTGDGRGLALSTALVVAVSTFSTFIDQIHWNFLGALGLTFFCIAAFAMWLRGGRSKVGWYGTALCLWFAAFASYTFQVGGILALVVLSLLYPAKASAPFLLKLKGTATEILPFGVLLILFVLIWTTTRNPAMSAYYELRPEMLLANLPASLWQGLWPARYAGFLLTAFSGLGLWLLLPWAVLGIGTGYSVRRVMLGSDPTAKTAGVILLIAMCVVLPTILIEAMSSTWTVGMRWLMVDQAWQPLLWLSLAWTLTATVPSLHRGFPMIAAIAVVLALTLSAGHNVRARSLAKGEEALRDGLYELVRQRRDSHPLHLVVLFERGVERGTPDVMNLRIAPVWFGDRPITLRTLQKDAVPAEAGHEAWWNIILTDREVRNVAIGGGDAPYDQVLFARFDGRDVVPLKSLSATDVAGYPIEWRRTQPLSNATSKPLTPSCDQVWKADDAGSLSGFRAAEADERGPFRWMIANPATVTLAPSCGVLSAHLRIDVGLWMEPVQWRSLMVKIRDATIPLTFSETLGHVWAKGDVPAGLLPTGESVPISLFVDGLRTVPGTDIHLGVAIREIRLHQGP